VERFRHHEDPLFIVEQMAAATTNHILNPVPGTTCLRMTAVLSGLNSQWTGARVDVNRLSDSEIPGIDQIGINHRDDPLLPAETNHYFDPARLVSNAMDDT
jgi:hypothetical protein